MKEKIILLTKTELESLLDQAVERAVNQASKLIQPEPKEKEILTLEETCEFLNLSKPTLYSLTSKKGIDHFKTGKKLYFKRSELLEWIESGRQKTKTK